MQNKGQFVKGQIPWNKGKFGYMSANKTSFTKEQAESNCKHSFGEAYMGKDQLICRIIETKPTKSYNGKVYQHHKRISYAKYLMEQTLGRALAKNEVVYHIDGDFRNNDLSNLEVITRAELLKRNHINKGA